MNPERELLPDPLPSQPLLLVQHWLQEARQHAIQPNPNAMVLATVDQQGNPHARVVLCKDICPEPGYVTFYTNYHSAKGRELQVHPRAAVVLHWDRLQRQVRIEGAIVPVSAAESDAYFASRSWQSRVGAWASAQSEPVGSRAELHAALIHTAERLQVPVPVADAPDPGVRIARPPHWGGYRLWADMVELWVEGAARIHDRARWTRVLKDFAAPAPWSVTRLQP